MTNQRFRFLVKPALLALLGFALLASWGLSSPVGSSPDDDFHLASIWCGQGQRDGLCENVTSEAVYVPENVVNAPCFAFRDTATASCQAALSTDMVRVEHVNSVERSYPAGFYFFHSYFVTDDVTTSVLIMRLLNAAIIVALSVVTFSLVERYWRYSLSLALIVTGIPLAAFIIPSTNPSSWAVLSPVFIFVLVRTMIRETNRVRAAASGLVTLTLILLASSARSDAAAFAIFALILAAIAEGRKWLRKPLFYSVAAGGALIAGLSVFQARQTTMAATGMANQEDGSAQSGFALLLRNILHLPDLIVGSLGTWKLGWLDTEMPSSVWVFTIVALGSLVVTSIAVKRQLRELWIPVLGFVALCFMPLFVLQNSGANVGLYVQPRYILPLLALSVIALLTTNTRTVSVSVRQDLIVLLLVGAANVIALAWNVKRYTDASTLTSASASISVLAPLGLGLLSTVLLAVLISRYFVQRRRNEVLG